MIYLIIMLVYSIILVVAFTLGAADRILKERNMELGRVVYLGYLGYPTFYWGSWEARKAIRTGKTNCSIVRYIGKRNNFYWEM
jgi:hypothetical protein